MNDSPTPETETPEGIQVPIEEVLAAYDAEITRLARENIMLKVQLQQQRPV